MDAKNRDRRDTQSEAAQAAKKGAGMWTKFREPRGWAANWDGFALSEMEQQVKRVSAKSR
jgi:hypothetical protein